MANTNDDKEREKYAGMIAMLTVMIQIREGEHGKPEDGRIAEAQNLVTRIQNDI